jgi:MFS family permease
MNQQRLFLGCFTALVATAFGFAVRSNIQELWQKEFQLSNEQVGYLGGVGLYPFAISIILLSLIIDKIGYGRAMGFAFFAHLASAVLTLFAKSFEMLYFATFLYALANGAVEAVINPVVATVYDKNKTHWLNILHAGWPGGLVIGGLLSVGIARLMPTAGWQYQMAIVFLPTILYGVLLFGQKFPVQERVAAGVTYLDMLKEFGWGSAYICSFLLIAGINQILLVAKIPALSMMWTAVAAIVPAVLFGIYVKSFGRPLFVLLLLVMMMLATTELGTDGWMPTIIGAILQNAEHGALFLVYTSFIMFVLRFFAGPIVHRISPLGLLAMCAAIAAIGLTWLSMAGTAALTLFLAATFYAFGKTFFWPTTLGVISEQFPKGGALMLNAISGVGMIAVGTLGGPGIGFVQDQDAAAIVRAEDETLATKVLSTKPGLFGDVEAIDQTKVAGLTPEEKTRVTAIDARSKQSTLGKIALLPTIMCVIYIGLIVYFQSKGGYQAEVLIGHGAEDKKFTGGLKAPMEG